MDENECAEREQDFYDYESSNCDDSDQSDIDSMDGDADDDDEDTPALDAAANVDGDHPHPPQLIPHTTSSTSIRSTRSHTPRGAHPQHLQQPAPDSTQQARQRGSISAQSIVSDTTTFATAVNSSTDDLTLPDGIESMTTSSSSPSTVIAPAMGTRQDASDSLIVVPVADAAPSEQQGEVMEENQLLPLQSTSAPTRALTGETVDGQQTRRQQRGEEEPLIDIEDDEPFDSGNRPTGNSSVNAREGAASARRQVPEESASTLLTTASASTLMAPPCSYERECQSLYYGCCASR